MHHRLTRVNDTARYSSLRHYSVDLHATPLAGLALHQLHCSLLLASHRDPFITPDVNPLSIHARTPPTPLVAPRRDTTLSTWKRHHSPLSYAHQLPRSLLLASNRDPFIIPDVTSFAVPASPPSTPLDALQMSSS